MSHHPIHFSFPSKLENIAKVEAVIEDLMNDGVLDEATYGNVLVAVTEAVLNAIQHGNKSNAEIPVLFSCSISESELSFTVEDQGPGFDPSQIPDPTDPENLEKINGRGIFIMQNLADDLSFENDGKRVSLKFSLNQAPVEAV